MSVRDVSGMTLTGEGRSTGRTTGPCATCHHESHMNWQGIEPGPRDESNATNRLFEGRTPFLLHSENSSSALQRKEMLLVVKPKIN